MRLNAILAAGLALMVATLVACRGDSPASAPAASGPTRAFMMGTTPFFVTPTQFPRWTFENMEDKDLVSLHADEFWGVPWDYCTVSGCTPPAAWVSKWTALASEARATGKTLYLAVSPLTGRKRLAQKVGAAGNTIGAWDTASLDSDGCYAFATDANAAAYKQAYIAYVKYLIDLVDPAYVSPAIEINMPFTQCPQQKSAWIAWYADVHNAIKQAWPNRVVFPTFQEEFMYGIAVGSGCPGNVTLGDCFKQRLAEALTLPGDRIAFSIYPASWKFFPDYNHSYPTDTFAEVKKATSRKIWIAETGWAAVKILQGYPHGSSGACGAELFPETISVSGVGMLDVANDAAHAQYLAWLLNEAQTQGFEAVIWWLNRDFFDGAAAAECPCVPAGSDTCVVADNVYQWLGQDAEVLLRFFSNMALRNYDGSPRPGHATWRDYITRTYRP